MSRVNDWADDDEDLPQTQITANKDGTQTIVMYSIEPNGQKVKRTQRIKRVTVKEIVHPKVAERAKWIKFGAEKGAPPGPQTSSTAIADNIAFQLAQPKKVSDKADDVVVEAKVGMSLKCRICTGTHWTNKCPYRESMMPENENMGEAEDSATPKTGAYVPVNRRAGAPMEASGKYERDDSTTLRVTNINDSVEEQDLRDLFNHGAVGKDGRTLGRVTRVFLARDKMTNRLKGFAFINFDTRAAAAAACEKLDGFGFRHLILKVDFPKPSPP